MKKKCFSLPILMFIPLMFSGYCQAEVLNTEGAPQPAVSAQKQTSQNDNATVATKAYPQETTKHLLPKARGDLLHIAFEKGYIGRGVKLEPVVLQAEYTIEVIVKPSEQQVACADMLGNNPGAGQYGFVVQLDSPDRNNYRMYVGDGTRWYNSDKFKLEAGIWHYLAVVCNEMNTIQIYVDGSLVGKFTPMTKLKNSPLPFQVGNYETGDRPFSGSIAEVRIANSPLDKKDIEMQWSKLQPKLSKM